MSARRATRRRMAIREAQGAADAAFLRPLLAAVGVELVRSPEGWVKLQPKERKP